MGKFKVGDRVRRVEPSDWPEMYGEVGKEYTVLETNSADNIVVIEGNNAAMARAFELVESQWQPKVGDRVRFTEDNPNGGAAYGEKGETFEVAACMSSLYGEQVSIKHPSFDWEPSAPISVLEPLPVAAEAQPLQIVAGRYYKTRDGRKAGPVVVGSDGEIAWGLTGDGSAYVFTETGRANYEDEHRDDFIAEWVDEPAVAVAASNDNAAPAKFKVGDRVYAEYGEFKGNGVITAFSVNNEFDNMHYRVKFDEGSDWELWVYNDTITSEKIAATPTAIVALIENGQPLPSHKPYVHATEAAAGKEAARLAGIHKGQEFGVYVLSGSTKVDKPSYEHEWQRLAMDGRKIDAIRLLRQATGLHLATAKTAVLDWVARAA